MIRAVFLCQFGLLLVANRVSTQSCYSCDSCSDPFSTVGATTVSCSTNLCYTTTATVTLFGFSSTIVSRGCDVNGTTTGCVTAGAGAGGLLGVSGTTTCTCSGDKCNSGAASGTSSQTCYLCSDCGDDPFSTTGAATIPCSSNLCYKMKSTITLIGVSTTVISRGCGTSGTSTGCVSGGGGLGSLVGGSGTTCTCSGQNCNIGTVKVASTVALIMSMTTVLMFC